MTTTSHAFIGFEIDGGVAQITLGRPDVLNSFNRQMAMELQETLRTCAEDAEIRAVLLTGSGRAFCAGQDLSEVIPGEGEPPMDLGEVVRTCYNPIIRAIRALEKPVIAAVNGVAAGAGANLALACDLVIASEKASFIQSFSKVGLIPDSGGTFFLPRLVGVAKATELMMLATKVPAAEAKAMGMIALTAAPEALQDDARKLATKLAAMPTRGLGLTKVLLNQSYNNDLAAQLEAEETHQSTAGFTEDYQAGVNAFLNRSAPTFKGR